MQNKVVKKFFNLVENSKEFYKDFLLIEPKNIYIPEIYLAIKEFIHISEKADIFSNLDFSYNLSPAEYNLIYFIGNNDHINITMLSKMTKSSKGYVSKIVKKLLEDNYIKTYQSSSNKKEIFLSLTKNGIKIYMDIYRELLQEHNKFDIFLKENFSDEELQNIFNFFTKINKFKNEEYLKSHKK